MNPTRPVATRAGRSTSDDGTPAVAATRFDFDFAFGFTAKSGTWRLPRLHIHAGRDACARRKRGAHGSGTGPGSRPYRPSATGEGR